jgi:hypothetical protein
MDKAQLETLLTSLDHWTAFFTFLVVFGVAGELVVHIRYSRVSGRLIALQHVEEQKLQAEIARLSSASAEANKIAAQANESTKQTELRTEELKKENLELQRRIANRFLTENQKTEILQSVKAYKGHVIIITRLGDAEASAYADSIMSTFEQAGWAIQINNVGMIAPPRYGIVCRTPLHPDPAIRSLITAFEKARVELTIEEVPTATSDSWVDMLVGLKPVT